MKLQLLHSTAINMEAEFGPKNWTLESFVPFIDGRLVMLAKRLGAGEFWLIQLHEGRVSKRQLPASLHAEIVAFADACFDQQNHYRCAPKAFALGEKLALLLADRKLYLLDDIDAELVPIEIDNTLAKYSSSFEYEEEDYATRGTQTRTFFASGFGPTLDQRVPVMFQGMSVYSASNFMALLSVDVAQGRAHWENGRLPQPPSIIKYRSPGHFGYTCFTHVAWLGGKGLAFYIGNSDLRHMTGESKVELLEVDAQANVLASRLTIGEACSGQFSPDLKWLLLTPRFKKYARKGKQTVVAMDTHVETPITLPRGCSKLRVLDIVGEHAWLANDDYSAIVTCRIAA